MSRLQKIDTDAGPIEVDCPTGRIEDGIYVSAWYGEHYFMKL